MAAVARKEAKTVPVIALTHAFQDLNRYRRGDEATITLAEGEKMPAWCVAEADAQRTRDGEIDMAKLPLFFPANTRLG